MRPIADKVPKMDYAMRWFGPGDPVSLPDIVQAGCSGVVTALHQIPIGEAWTEEVIARYKKGIEDVGLCWKVVESLPVHEDIKMQSGRYKHYIENYEKSLVNLAAQGIEVVTYNFMPVLDWLRTDVNYALHSGQEALRFCQKELSVFDLFILQRPGAEEEYSADEKDSLYEYFSALPDEELKRIENNMLLGLPGSDTPFTHEEILEMLDKYKRIDRAQLKSNLYFFLDQILPVAEENGIKMAIHPDDPPFPVLGLPRIMSTSEDIKDMVLSCPSPANGLCFCTGSFGARPDNDILGMINEWGSRIFFLHLRNTKRDAASGDFFEANHLEGDTDMYAVIREIVQLMNREKRNIPMRPDHGHKMLDDLNKSIYPGYSAIGRLKGLAELRGLEYGISRTLSEEY